MPWGLKRYYGTGCLHFITWSCYRRKPLLGNPARRDLVLTILELMRVRYRFAVVGYVVMPEHVHLLISEPLIGDPQRQFRRWSWAFPGGWPYRENSPVDSGRVVSMVSICGANRKRPRSWSKCIAIRWCADSWRVQRIGGGVATAPMLAERRDWFGSTIGLGGRRKFDGVLVEDW